MRKVRVLTCAYRGYLDRKLINNFAEITSRDKIDGLALIVKDKKMPKITRLASSKDIPISRFDSAKEFCEAYSGANDELAKQKYVVCITYSLGCASAVLRGLPRTLQTQLDTQY